MKQIEVLCEQSEQVLRQAKRQSRLRAVAAIIRDAEGRIFATQRGYGEFKDGWEFPGGKMEPGETPEEAIKREIWEELETHIGVDELLCTVEHDYTQFHLRMHCYLCHIEEGHPVLLEHEAARWLTREQLGDVDWLPADWQVIERLRNEKHSVTT